MSIALHRGYWINDMAHVSDSVDTFDGTHYYVWTGTPPSWFDVEPFYPGATEHYPSFSFTVPQGFSGTHTFGVQKYTNAGVLEDVGLFQINAQNANQTLWNIPSGCYTANIAWLNPTGGWQSYLFVGKQQEFQDKGNSTSYINSDREKRYHRIDGLHQGTMITTGNVTRNHVDLIRLFNKSIQAYLWTSGNGFVPILLERKKFKAPKSGEPFAKYDFEFRYAEEDVIQTQ